MTKRRTRTKDAPSPEVSVFAFLFNNRVRASQPLWSEHIPLNAPNGSHLCLSKWYNSQDLGFWEVGICNPRTEQELPSAPSCRSALSCLPGAGTATPAMG